MRIASPSAVIDPNLRDESGFSFDLGMRSEQTVLFSYDISGFYLSYNNRIGEIQTYDNLNRIIRQRGNIGKAIIQGIEAYGEIDAIGFLTNNAGKLKGEIFGNIAFITSEYVRSENSEVVGREVEFVPAINLKSGVRIGFNDFKASLQYMYVGSQFTDASNARDGGVAEVTGEIPAYSVIDFSSSYQYKRFKVEATINNVANTMYFTRRATGYPGPGILPSDGRGLYLTLQVRI